MPSAPVSAQNFLTKLSWALPWTEWRDLVWKGARWRRRLSWCYTRWCISTCRTQQINHVSVQSHPSRRSIAITTFSQMHRRHDSEHQHKWFSIWRIRETNLMSLVIMFYVTSSMLNMFQTLILPSSWVCDFSIISPHWSCVLVSVWLGWGGIRVAGCFSLLHGYHPNPTTPKLQHTSKKEHTTNVAIQ